MTEHLHPAARSGPIPRILQTCFVALVVTLALIVLAGCGAAATDTGPTVEGSNDAGEGAATSAYADIPQSRTPEGYFVLGPADAPILIQHYSDFL